MSKYTPGPWHVSDERTTDIVIRNAERDPVALSYSSGWDKKTARANAAIVAMAPEVIEQLRGCIDAIHAVLAMAQKHDPATGYYEPVDPYEILRVLQNKQVCSDSCALLRKAGVKWEVGR